MPADFSVKTATMLVLDINMGDQLAMTDCNKEQFEFQAIGRRRVVAAFDAGHVTSDAGGLLLREAMLGSQIVDKLATAGFVDHRDPDRIAHSVRDLVAQRILGLALGYEDLNDHDHLRNDALFSIAVGKVDADGAVPLAGKSTLNRLELTRNDDGRTKRIAHVPHKIADCLTEAGLDGLSINGAPKEIWLDVDATDDPTHGEQEGKHFHAFYDAYCFLPLYIFAGHEILAARLRTSDCEPMEGAVEEIERIVARIRERWPETKIFVRGDSGFCTDSLMSWCEVHGVGYVLGLAKNSRLLPMIERELDQAKRLQAASRKPERIFKDLRYQTLQTWSCERRVVAKAEHIDGKANPRFVVTSIDKQEIEASQVYEGIYCARGDMENRIKEQQMGLFADRTSSHTLLANQLRLWFSSFAYALLQRVRSVGLRGTELARAQAWTIRQRLFKMGAVVAFSVRRVSFSISGAQPLQSCFAECLRQLRSHYGFS